MENSYSFAAIRGVQAGRVYYVAMVSLRMMERLFQFDGEELPHELRAQRDLNLTPLPAIARYINANPREYVLSALSASIGGAFSFEPSAAQRSLGTLRVDMEATILINDGQHRRAGIIEALRERRPWATRLGHPRQFAEPVAGLGHLGQTRGDRGPVPDRVPDTAPIAFVSSSLS